MNKFRNKHTQVDNLHFASLKEATRYQELKILLNAGVICGLEMQPKFPLVVNGQKVCTYIADFQYTDRQTGATTVEDVKGVLTPVYRMKKKLVKALYGIEIVEV